MKSTLKTVIPLALLFAVAFGAFFIKQYSPKVDEKAGDKLEKGSNEPPLRFFASARQWNPKSPVLLDRIFPGFYEKDGRGAASFWFENRNPKPVVMQLKSVSCSSCSDGELTPIPKETARSILEMTAIGALPQGLFGGLTLGLSGAAAGLAPDRLQTQSHEFRTKDWTFKVPAADEKPTGWTPQWGILTLNFSAGPRMQLGAQFAVQVENTTQYAENEFAIFYRPSDPLQVPQPEIKVGDLDDNSGERAYEIVVFSPTRGEGAKEKLAVPTVTVLVPGGGEAPGRFIETGTPIPLGPTDLAALADEMEQKSGVPVRVRAGYRIPVVLRTKVGEDRLDIGLLERDLWISAGDATKQNVKLTATVRGGVRLSEGREIDLKSFSAKAGFVEKAFEVVTDNPAIEVSLAKTEVEERGPDGQTRKVLQDHVVVNNRVAPDVLKVKVEKQNRKEPDRGYYWVKVSIPPDALQGQLMGGSYVVLDLKGPTNRRYQIPLKGTATR